MEGRAAAKPATAPISLAAFEGDFTSIRLAGRDHKNMAQWYTYDEPAGHCAARLEPQLMAEQIRGFCRGLR